ncbi:hypothetical protein ACN9JY_00215 [Aliarcobacter butzleri]|uniref:hypothetical protein n=1 Tax=Aliarcobacter butzleri TaxID=28197 RepID=UPI003B217DF0
MCLKNKRECTLTTIKILGVLLLTNLMLTAIGIEYSPLYWIANFTYDSLPLVKGTELVNSNIEKWAIRGQIGDIMSGHFSALAVLAVAYSITLQVEANKKMTESIEKQEKALRQTEETILQQKLSIEKQTEANLEQAKSTLQQAQAIELQAKSIEQQNKALKVQSETLKAQIEELKESREESKRQTEEFFIQNMNSKLERYYKLVDDEIKRIGSEKYKKLRSGQIDFDFLSNSFDIENSSLPFERLFRVLNLIYDDIALLKNSYPNAYSILMKEFSLRFENNDNILDVVIYTQYKPFKRLFEDISSVWDED